MEQAPAKIKEKHRGLIDILIAVVVLIGLCIIV